MAIAQTAADAPAFGAFLGDLEALEKRGGAAGPPSPRARPTSGAGGDKRLQSYLIEPVQRIPRYKLLLQELLKRTPQRHPDHAPLAAALAEVARAAAHCNAELARQDNRKQACGLPSLSFLIFLLSFAIARFTEVHV